MQKNLLILNDSGISCTMIDGGYEDRTGSSKGTMKGYILTQTYGAQEATSDQSAGQHSCR
jgi:hypothetical protein